MITNHDNRTLSSSQTLLQKSEYEYGLITWGASGVVKVTNPIPVQESDGELGGPENDLRLLLSSLVLSSGLGTRLAAEAPESTIHATCTSSASSDYTSHKFKSNNQLNCCSFPLHATACCCSSLLRAMHCLLRLAPQCNAFC